MNRDIMDVINKFESINEYGQEYDESYGKEDILKVLKEYGTQVFVKYSHFASDNEVSVFERFSKAIGVYIRDEEILTELFRLDGKLAIESISEYTDLLKDKETETLVYNCAIRGVNRNIESLEEQLAVQEGLKQRFQSGRDKSLGIDTERKSKEFELQGLIKADEQLSELMEKAKKWDELQAKKEPDKNTELYSDEYNDELYED